MTDAPKMNAEVPNMVAANKPPADSAASKVNMAPAISDVTAQLNTIARDIGDVGARLTRQQAVIAAATRVMRAAPANAEASGTAELERTRLERIGGQVGDLRDRLDAIAGTLADAFSSGTDTTSQIRQAGGLIARTRALDEDYTAAMASAAAALSR